jgi:hypothetical protein
VAAANSKNHRMIAIASDPLATAQLSDKSKAKPPAVRSVILWRVERGREAHTCRQWVAIAKAIQAKPSIASTKAVKM